MNDRDRDELAAAVAALAAAIEHLAQLLEQLGIAAGYLAPSPRQDPWRRG